MKKYLAALLLAFAPAFASAQATNFNLWTPKGIAVPNAGGVIFSNPNAIYSTTGCFLVSNPCTRMWAGANSSGGFPTGISYFESSDGLTGWTAYSGNPISSCLLPKVWQTTAGGTIYIYCGAGVISVYTTLDGVTLTLANSSAIVSGGAGSWDLNVYQLQVIDIIGGTWYGYYNGENATLNPSNPSQMGVATSTDLIHWAKYGGNPVITNLVCGSNFTFLKVNSVYYGYYDGCYNNTLSPPFNHMRAVFRASATNVLGPWTQLTDGTTPVAVYYPAIASDFHDFSMTFTLGDPSIYAINGNLYLYYSIGSGGFPSGMGEAVALNAAPSAATSGYEGVVGVPSSGAPQLNLVTLASDSGTGANANPIGGNWTAIVSGHNAQRASNVIEPANTTNAGSIYWNALTWPNNQWLQLTIVADAITNQSTVGPSLRASTSGANTYYDVVALGPVNGTATEWFMQSKVAGVNTNLQVNGGSTFTPNVGDKMMLAVNGTNLYFYWNSVLIGYASDSAITTGAVGLGVFDSSAVTNAQISNFLGGKFLSPSGGIGGTAGVGGKAGIGQ